MGTSSSKKARDATAVRSNSSIRHTEQHSYSSRNPSHVKSRNLHEGSHSPRLQSPSHTVSPKGSRTRERPSAQHRLDGTKEPFAFPDAGRRRETVSKGSGGGGVGGPATHANYSNDYKRFLDSSRHPRQKEKRGNSLLSHSHEAQRNHRGPVQKMEEATLPCDELLQFSASTSEAAGTPSKLSTSRRTRRSNSAAAVSNAPADDRSSSRTRSGQQSARAVLPSPAYEEEGPAWFPRTPPNVPATSSKCSSRSRSSDSSRRGVEDDTIDDGEQDDGNVESRGSEPVPAEQEEVNNGSRISLSFDIDLSGVGTAVPGDEDLNGYFTQKSSFSSFSDTDIQALIFREYAARRQASKLSSHSSKATSRISIRTTPHHRIEVVVPAEICDRLPALVKEVPAASRVGGAAPLQRDPHSNRHRKAGANSTALSVPTSAAESGDNRRDIRQHVFSFTRCDMSGTSLPLTYKHYRAKHLQQDKSAQPPKVTRKQVGRVCVHQSRNRKSAYDASDYSGTHPQQQGSAEARRAAMAACYSFFASSHRDPNHGVNTFNNNNNNNNRNNGASDGCGDATN